MGKVITVWGSPGSGKSMFSCILAKALTRDKRKAIIINAEISVPMLPVWLPEQIIQTNASVGQVLSSVEIDTSLVAGHVTVLKSYPFIGVMGYAAGENPLSYPEVKYAMVLQLVNAAARLVDFVILDCSSNMTNVFTPAAIESGDLVIRILTPDLKGVNYLKAHQPLLGDGRFHYDQHMTFAGMARPFHALDEMGHIIGGWDGLLPYGKEIDRCATEGGMFQAIKYCNPKYTASLNKVLDALEQMELADHAAEDDGNETEHFEEETADEYPIIVFTKQLEDRSRKIMEIIEGECCEGERLIYRTLYSYNVLDNTVDADGRPLVVGRHKKVSEMSSSLQKRLLDNGISHKELDEFLEHDKEVLNGCRGFTSYASPSSPLDS